MIQIESNPSTVRSTSLTNSLTRNFGYRLTDKKATANFLKAASKEAFELDEKQKCIILVFSVGAYMKCVLPVIKEWQHRSEEFTSGKLQIKVINILPSFDESGKNVETIFTFLVNSQKVTVTCFNTTQKMKVEGNGYTDLVHEYIEKLFLEKIKYYANDIDDYNKAVVATLSGKRKAVSRPLRSVRYKSLTTYACTSCDSTFASSTQLSIHRKVHSVTSNDASKLPIIDDLSLMDISSIDDRQTTSAVELNAFTHD